MARTMLKTLYGDEIYNFITQPSHYQAALDGSETPLFDQAIPTFPDNAADANDDKTQASHTLVPSYRILEVITGL